MTKSMQKQKKIKKVKAWAVLGYPDRLPMVFGGLANGSEGAMTIFVAKSDAERMGKNIDSWKVVPCTITYQPQTNKDMNYELCKELKEAGFPQHLGVGEECLTYECFTNQDVCRPTLSELIEACGGNFGELNHYRNSGDWEVKAKDWVDEQGVGRFSSGKTPEEAIARLWLALTDKNCGKRREDYFQKR